MDRGSAVLAEFPELERAGFEAVERSRERILIHWDGRDALLEELLSDFLGIDPGDRRTFRHGRAPHFSNRPRGAPGRVGVEMQRLHEAGSHPADFTVGIVVISGEAAFIVDLDKTALRGYLGGAWCLRDLCHRCRCGLWRHRLWRALEGATPPGFGEAL